MFVKFETISVNSDEIFAIVPQMNENTKKFTIVVISKNGISVPVMDNIDTFQEAINLCYNLSDLVAGEINPAETEEIVEAEIVEEEPVEVKSPQKKSKGKKE